jgi:hypothetical protein
MIQILTYDNKVGIVKDAILLKTIVDSSGHSSSIEYIDKLKPDIKCEIGIWIQNFDLNYLSNFKKNIFFINEEWAGNYELNNLHLFDYVICKSLYAKSLLSHVPNIVYLPFLSRNCYDPSVNRTDKYLHFMGRSIQKNTDLVLNQNINITLIDSYNRYRPNSNFNHINTYQTDDQIIELLNSHEVHICCSLYESWGHYMFEGLSTGAEIICSDIPMFKEQLDPELVHFIPTHEKIDMSYIYCSDNVNNLYRYRKSFFVDETYFHQYVKNFKPIGKNEDRRRLFNDIMSKNKLQMMSFFKNI